MAESRTRERALAELLRLLPAVRESVVDERVREVLTEELVREVFKAAWDRQFDDDRTVTARVFRQIIRERLEGLEDQAHAT